MIKELAQSIQKNLMINGDPYHALMVDKYFKGVVKSYGVRGPVMQQIIKNYYKEIKLLDIDRQIQLWEEMISSDVLDNKSFGIHMLSRSIRLLNSSFMTKLQSITDKYVYDWASCDILSSKVITNIILKDKQTIKTVKSRKNNKNPWLQRSACVSFVRIARTGEYNDVILEICGETIKNNDRFVQLGTGWVLRELSLADINLVKNFIISSYDLWSREGLRYAVEKMKDEDKKIILNYKKRQ